MLQPTQCVISVDNWHISQEKKVITDNRINSEKWEKSDAAHCFWLNALKVEEKWKKEEEREREVRQSIQLWNKLHAPHVSTRGHHHDTLQQRHATLFHTSAAGGFYFKHIHWESFQFSALFKAISVASSHFNTTHNTHILESVGESTTKKTQNWIKMILTIQTIY